MRKKSDFLLYKNQSGLFADFHANRHTFIINLARVGVSLKVAQTLAWHSDIRLTMNVYTHTDLAEKACAIAKLPSFEKHRAATSVWEVPASSQSNLQQRFSSSGKAQMTTSGSRCRQ